MTYTSVARDARAYGLIAIAALIVAYGAGGPAGLLGVGLGLASASFGIFGLFVLATVLARLASSGARSGIGSLASILLFLAKVPIYILAGRAALALGAPGFACFLGGLVLVYFVSVAWAAAR